MKLEVGKKYVARNGDVVQIVECDWEVQYPFEGDNDRSYLTDGSEYRTQVSTLDLISEYQEPSNFIVGNTYTDAGGREWECIAVNDEKAWLTMGRVAYAWALDGVSKYLDADYNIKLGPVKEHVEVWGSDWS